MKIIVVLIIAVSFPVLSFSQTTDEWVHQKKLQRKYLLQQIIAFKTYLGYMKQGYDIAQKGIVTVQHIKNGEWDLHKDYFGSLKVVNPSIMKYGKLVDIATMMPKTVQQAKSLLSNIKLSKQLNAAEIDNTVRTCKQVISECMKSVDELMLVITSGKLEMKDDERLKRIEIIYEQTQEHYVFIQSFQHAVLMLQTQRMRENNEIETAKQLNGLK